MLWLWHRLAAAAPIQPLAWEPPHAVGEALKKLKKKIRNEFKRYFLIPGLAKISRKNKGEK